MVIALSGGIKSGKDTVTEITIELLKDKYSNIENRKFADKLKDMVCLMIGFTREQLEDRDLKTKPLGKQWERYKVTLPTEESNNRLFGTFEEAKAYVYQNWTDWNGINIIKEELTPRKLMLWLGTEAGREIIHPNIWCNALFADYDADSNWVISDCRFVNEVDIIKSNGGHVIDIKREFAKRFPNNADDVDKLDKYGYDMKLKDTDPELYETLTHPSETAINDVVKDATIVNNGTLAELRENIREILTDLSIL